jgi:hypothetical protein
VKDRDVLARRAVTEALRFRNRRGCSPNLPICPIDLALDDGIDVRLEPIGSLEGMYTPDGPLIIIGSLRPRGRRAYTCAHELGHHVFGHGLRIDELLGGEGALKREDDTEYMADRFAAALLMPKLAVLNAFAVRRWDIPTCEPEHVFTISGVLGVGYTTLISYLEGTLGVIGAATAVRLRKASPKTIRGRILGMDGIKELVVVDEFWSGRAVDAEVGDILLVPAGASASGNFVKRTNDRLLQAMAPGMTRLVRGNWAADLRIMRPGYEGLACYRYLEEVDDGD